MIRQESQPASATSAPTPATGNSKTIAAHGAFTIKVGDKIADGISGPGAGTIETPYRQAVYVFSAAPGQKVYFHIAERCKGMEYIKWRLADDNGMELYDACLACSEPGVQTLSKGGAYTLTVGNLRNPATGDYALRAGLPLMHDSEFKTL